jgi:hypothetical protein
MAPKNVGVFRRLPPIKRPTRALATLTKPTVVVGGDRRRLLGGFV